MKILYDGRILLNILKKNSDRSGIFWVFFNLFNYLQKNKNIEISLFFENISDYLLYLKNKEYFNTLFNNKCFNDGIFITVNINKVLKIIKIDKKLLELKNNSKFFLTKAIFSLIKSFYKKKIKNLNKKYSDFYIKNIDKINNFDLFLSPFHAIPDFIKQNNYIKSGIVLHDTMPLNFPEYYKNFNLNDGSYYAKIINSLDKNTYCFCISEQTKKDFLKYCGDRLDENKMFVMPIATAQDFYPDKNEEKLKKVLDKYNVSKNQRGKYIFSLCTLEPRKNLIFTIKCFIEFIKENKIDDLYFYLGGGHWDDFIGQLEKEIYDLDKYKDKIVKLGYVDDEDVNTLYSNSLFFTYISLYEGFGMPPLEAMSCGAPVLTSNTSSIPEVVGDAAIMIDPTDKQACINAMKDLYFNENLREELSKKGLEQAKKFSWDKTVDIIVKNLK